MFVENKWYEIILPYGKKFTALYTKDTSGTIVEWFTFTDGSRKLVKDITPFAKEIVMVEAPGNSLDIVDFLDDLDD